MSALEHEFHRLSRKLHPDRFARAVENEKQWSLADTALLNDAYRTLKDPLRRTEYLLKLQGAEIGDEPRNAKKKRAARVPADLLEEVFELNMQLEEMRAARETGEADPDSAGQPGTGKEEDSTFCWRRWTRICALSGRCGMWATLPRGKRRRKNMVALLDRRRYLSNLVRDVNEVLGA